MLQRKQTADLLTLQFLFNVFISSYKTFYYNISVTS